MRHLSVRLFGVPVLSVDIEDDEPEAEEFETYQDAGTTGSTPIGFAPSPQPEWERPLNGYDEPDEGDEDV